jgi:hypothetical protein
VTLAAIILARFQPLLTKNDSIYLVVLSRRFPLLEWSETGRISIKKKQGLLLDRHGPAKCGLLDDSKQLCKTSANPIYLAEVFFNLPSNV